MMAASVATGTHFDVGMPVPLFQSTPRQHVLVYDLFVYYDANHVSHGFLRDRDGAITSFEVPDSNGGTFVTDMSPSGEITGYYDDNDEYPQPQRGFLRSRDGAYTTFAPPGRGMFFLPR